MQSNQAAVSVAPSGGSKAARRRKASVPVAQLELLEAESRRQRSMIDALIEDAAGLRAANSDLLAELATITTTQAVAANGALDPVEAIVRVGPQAPAAARAAVTQWLTGRVTDRVLDDARLLVSELVTNSLQHGDLPADAPVRISAHVARGVLRLEVHNPGHDGSVARRIPDPGNGGGFGLHLVELLASRWGVSRANGTRVWFELAALAPAT